MYTYDDDDDDTYSFVSPSLQSFVPWLHGSVSKEIFCMNVGHYYSSNKYKLVL
jgi:hypothetical protein